MPKLFKNFMANPAPSYLDVFKEGVRAQGIGIRKLWQQATGRDFQKLSQGAFFAVQFAAIGLRNIRKHWGPINRHDAEIKADADSVLKEVQQLIEQDKLGPLL